VGSCGNLLAQKLTRALKARTDCALRNPKNPANLARVEIIVRRKYKRYAELFWKRINHRVNQSMVVSED